MCHRLVRSGSSGHSSAPNLQEVTESKNIKIKPVIDEALLGGFIVEYGDNRVDLSVRGHLDSLALQLDSNAVASQFTTEGAAA